MIEKKKAKWKVTTEKPAIPGKTCNSETAGSTGAHKSLYYLLVLGMRPRKVRYVLLTGVGHATTKGTVRKKKKAKWRDCHK